MLDTHPETRSHTRKVGLISDATFITQFSFAPNYSSYLSKFKNEEYANPAITQS
jgi:hypothetical protein